jgi:hypothetical protein
MAKARSNIRVKAASTKVKAASIKAKEASIKATSIKPFNPNIRTVKTLRTTGKTCARSHSSSVSTMRVSRTRFGVVDRMSATWYLHPPHSNINNLLSMSQSQFLVTRGYPTDERSMVIMADDRKGPFYPTGQNMLAAMDWLVSEVHTCPHNCSKIPTNADPSPTANASSIIPATVA